jgi:hypothetical protein
MPSKPPVLLAADLRVCRACHAKNQHHGHGGLRLLDPLTNSKTLPSPCAAGKIRIIITFKGAAFCELAQNLHDEEGAGFRPPERDSGCYR